MKIVTDSGADLVFPYEVPDIETVPLVVTLDDKSYREGIDIEISNFYDLLANTKGLPITSQPSAGDFAEIYRRLAEQDKDILSIHISSGLSGTYNAAKAGSEMVPEANITLFDAKTLSAVAGWLVEAASRAVRAGWETEQIVAMMERIQKASYSFYTLRELKYLINGGRISHMKGLIASLLNIKPVIGVENEGGTYEQLGQARTFKRALDSLIAQMAERYPFGSKLRVQVLHSFNQIDAQVLRDKIDQLFDCEWLPIASMSLVLGAHTGPSMVGVAFAPQEVFANLP